MTKEWVRPARRLFVAASVLGFLVAALPLPNQPVNAAAGIQPAFAPHPSANGMTAEELFSKLLEHNRMREARLQGYSVTRTYKVKNDKEKVRAESQVSLQYRAPVTKEFKILSEQGSGMIRRMVFKPLMESELEAASGSNKRDSSLTPANYTFELLGEEDVDGHHCFAVQATPTRNDKYLFRGKVWIHATEFAVVRVEGQPARNPSWWTKRVDFVRRYQKIGEFWLPLRDETVTQVRIFGRNILIIDHYNYGIG